jgi:hypothetical protein
MDRPAVNIPGLSERKYLLIHMEILKKIYNQFKFDAIFCIVSIQIYSGSVRCVVEWATAESHASALRGRPPIMGLWRDVVWCHFPVHQGQTHLRESTSIERRFQLVAAWTLRRAQQIDLPWQVRRIPRRLAARLDWKWRHDDETVAIGSAFRPIADCHNQTCFQRPSPGRQGTGM